MAQPKYERLVASRKPRARSMGKGVIGKLFDENSSLLG